MGGEGLGDKINVQAENSRGFREKFKRRWSTTEFSRGPESANIQVTRPFPISDPSSHPSRLPPSPFPTYPPFTYPACPSTWYSYTTQHDTLSRGRERVVRVPSGFCVPTEPVLGLNLQIAFRMPHRQCLELMLECRTSVARHETTPRLLTRDHIPKAFESPSEIVVNRSSNNHYNITAG